MLQSPSLYIIPSIVQTSRKELQLHDGHIWKPGKRLWLRDSEWSVVHIFRACPRLIDISSGPEMGAFLPPSWQ